MEQKTKSVFETLNAIDCSEHTETKGKLTYLSWAWAWQILKKNYPTATYKIYEDANGRFYHTDGRTAWVKTGVTVEGIENIEYLPVMDYHNKSITIDRVTSFDVNKSIQRSLTKAVARHGLGLYIYAGEDLPEETAQQQAPQPEQPTKTMNIDRDMAFDDVRNAKSSQGVADVWNQHQWLHKDAEFVALVKEVGGKLKAENK
jgi:hypothetical protein